VLALLRLGFLLFHFTFTSTQMAEFFPTISNNQRVQEIVNGAATAAFAQPASAFNCDAEPLENYDFPLHIGAVFIVLGAALIGTILPVIGKAHKRLRLNDYVFSIGKSFGTGVILATGFIHMLSPAEQNLTSPCLPPAFNKDFKAYAGLFALIAVLSTQLIQTTAINHFKKRRAVASVDQTPASTPIPAPHAPPRTTSITDSDDTHATQHDCAHHHHTHAPSGTRHDHLESSHKPSVDSSRAVELGALAVATNIHSDGCCDVDHILFANGDHEHRKITAIVLEAGTY
jgi:hypothetical protein